MNVEVTQVPSSAGWPGRLVRAGRVALFENPGQCLLALLPLLFCVPWNPTLSSSNYEDQLHLDYILGSQYGRDILATYGPLGFLGIPFYHPETFPLLIGFNVVVYALAILRLVVVSRRLGVRRVGLTACLVFLPNVIDCTFEWAPILFVPFILIILYVLETTTAEAKLSWGVEAVYGVVLAAFTLMKLTFAPIALIAIIFCSIDQVRRGAIPKGALIYLASFILLWVAMGQSIGNIAAFASSSAQIVSGYKDGVGLWDLYMMMSAVPLVFAQAMIWLAATVAAWRTVRWGVLIVSPMLALVFYSILLNGYIRADIYHTLPCSLATISVLALLDPLIRSAGQDRWRWLPAAARFAVLPSLVSIAMMLAMTDPGSIYRQFYDRPFGLTRLLLKGTAPLKKKIVAAEAALGEQLIPGLEGVTADLPTGDPGVVPASGAILRLRPTVTTYSAYTPMLARANADFLEKPSGPDAVLLNNFDPLDDKYPTIDDTFSYLSLASHFRFARTVEKYHLFERRNDPLAIRLVPLPSRTFAIGEDVVVPHDGSRAIWAEIALKPNRVGRLIASAYKPIPVSLVVTLEDGAVHKHRIIVRMAESGFLLSPYLADIEMIRSVAGDFAEGQGANAVRSLRIESTSNQSNLNVNKFFEPQVEARFFAVHFDPAPPR